MARSYCNHFKKINNTYMKDNHEVYSFCGSRYASSDQNIINRLKNSLLKAINNHGKFAKYIMLVLDTYLADYIEFDGAGLASLLGGLIEWLVKKFLQLVKNRLEIMPQRARKEGYPQIYWMAPPHQCNFMDNATRTKIVNCLESVFKVYSSVRLIRMKEIWHYDDTDLVDVHGNFTSSGLSAYWRSVDAAVRFNANKRELFLARKLIRDSTPKVKESPKDKMIDFFKRKRNRNFSSNQSASPSKPRKLPTLSKSSRF